MKNSEIHKQFTKDLITLIGNFCLEHPDLFVNDINIISNKDETGRKHLVTTDVEIIVQPK